MGASHSTTAVVEGHVAKGYESVQEMFKNNVETGRERDAQLCVYVDGEKVVDLWGSAEGDPSYTADSLQCIFSSSKAVTAIAVAQLAQRGLLNCANPVANYWPEFAQNLKAEITIADMLRHEGGLPHLDTSVQLDCLLPHNLANGTLATILAKQSPIFPLNTPREYHNLTAGWVINEVFRRQSPGNVTIGSWLETEITKPLEIDVFMPVSEEIMPRVKSLQAFSKNMAFFQSFLPNALGGQVDHNIIVFTKILKSFQRRFLEEDKRGYAPDFPDMDPGMDPSLFITSFFNSTKWRQGESPHGNVHASARGLGKLAAAMANGGTLGGVEILSLEGWNHLHGNPVIQEDATMSGCRTEFTQTGVNMFNDYPDDVMGERILKSGRNGFVGWMGFGGSVMQWHPRLNLGFGYTCTLLTWWDLANTKARKLQKEATRCAVLVKQEKEKKLDLNNNVTKETSS
eukprot:GFUD01004625.1.p1 GENE.GFUD01004625.1~~GFUD01004625.1.p1  ORF type:complete len:457 (+),score=129.58 GFUD01004625.1:76-1446(+)